MLKVSLSQLKTWQTALLGIGCVLPLSAAETGTESEEVKFAPEQSSDLYSKDLGQAKLRLIDLSAITQISVGGSDGTAEELEWSQTGGHDPRNDGFNFQSLEVSIAGAVDPYFRAEAYLLITEDHGLELEEAFAVTTNLPHGFEVEAGLMLMEFGRYNPIHAHEYAHIDQPLVIGEMMGGEGTRDLGARVGWLMPTPWFSELHLTLMNGDNETAISFLGEGHAHGDEAGHDDHDDDDDDDHDDDLVALADEHDGDEGGSRNISGLDDMLISGRWVNGFATGSNSEVQIGLSAAYGPNKMADHTVLGGADIVLKWFNPRAKGRAGTLSWTNEYIQRDVGALDADEEVSDWGIVSTLVYDVSSHWGLGFRYDYVELEVHEDDDHDEEEHHTPAKRTRYSPLISYRPSEFTKFRLQYNYTDPDEGDAIQSVWLGLEVLIGTHPAHNF